MTNSPLHVVFGAGQVGLALISHLVGEGKEVRVISIHRPTLLPDGVDLRLIDAANHEAAAEAAKGAAVIYQCLNAPYAKWPERFPPLQRGVVAAAERTGALLVTLENVYGYGPTDGSPMTEDLPLAATTVKGRARAEMTRELFAASKDERIRITIGRASDFFGAGVTESTFGDHIFARALAGKKADFIGNPDFLHTYSYVPDIARGLATLGADDRAIGQVWHLPGPETVTTRDAMEMVSTEVGFHVGIRNVPKAILSILSLFSPTMKSISEMSYEFDAPFVLDTSKYQSTFGRDVTPLKRAIADTVTWYKSHEIAF